VNLDRDPTYIHNYLPHYLLSVSRELFTSRSITGTLTEPVFRGCLLANLNKIKKTLFLPFEMERPELGKTRWGKGSETGVDAM